MRDREAVPFHTACPVVRTERRRFERVCDVSGGLHIYDVVAFDAGIHWVRMSETVASVVDGDGRPVRSGQTNNDFYGLLSSVEEPVSSDVARLVGTFDVRAGGRLSVTVVTRVRDVPCVPDGGAGPGIGGRKAYRDIPRDWTYGPCPELAAWVARMREGGNPYMEDVPFVRPVEHDPLVWFDSRAGMDLAVQAGRALEGIGPYLEGVPQEEADGIRRKLAKAVEETRAAGVPA